MMSEENKRCPASFDRKYVTERLEVRYPQLYDKIPEGDVVSRYSRAHRLLREALKFATLNPMPTPPDELGDQVTDYDLGTVEAALVAVSESLMGAVAALPQEYKMGVISGSLAQR